MHTASNRSQRRNQPLTPDHVHLIHFSMMSTVRKHTKMGHFRADSEEPASSTVLLPAGISPKLHHCRDLRRPAPQLVPPHPLTHVRNVPSHRGLLSADGVAVHIHPSQPMLTRGKGVTRGEDQSNARTEANTAVFIWLFIGAAVRLRRRHRGSSLNCQSLYIQND